MPSHNRKAIKRAQVEKSCGRETYRRMWGNGNTSMDGKLLFSSFIHGKCD